MMRIKDIGKFKIEQSSTFSNRFNVSDETTKLLTLEYVQETDDFSRDGLNELFAEAPRTLNQRNELLEMAQRLIKTLPPSYYSLKAEANELINSCK